MLEYFENLNTASIKDALIFLDIDGTLVADNENCPSEEVLKKVKSLSERNVVWLCSNNFNVGRNKTMHRLTGLSIIRGHRKPSMKILDCVSDEERAMPMLVIGDKVITDGLFAWRISARFIKVKRKTNSTDRWFVRIYNLTDNIVYNLLKLWGIFT